jgi:hypothetical protein
MDDFPLLAHIDFCFSVPSLPWHEPDWYVFEIRGSVKAMVNETEEDEIGTIKLLKVKAIEARNARVRLEDVCDAHSDFLVALYSAIFKKNGTPRPELKIEAAWEELLVLCEFEMKDEYRAKGLLAQAFETAIAAFGSQGIIAAAREMPDGEWAGIGLTVDEWCKLSFAKIARSEFVFRDNCYENPYRKTL